MTVDQGPVAFMLQISDQTIIVAKSPVQPGAFTGLADRHPQAAVFAWR
jgi:hypothetical protein